MVIATHQQPIMETRKKKNYIYVYSLVLCYNILQCPLSGPDLTYISLLIIFCIIEYVTNKTLDTRASKIQHICDIFCELAWLVINKICSDAT